MTLPLTTSASGVSFTVDTKTVGNNDLGVGVVLRGVGGGGGGTTRRTLTEVTCHI